MKIENLPEFHESLRQLATRTDPRWRCNLRPLDWSRTVLQLQACLKFVAAMDESGLCETPGNAEPPANERRLN